LLRCFGRASGQGLRHRARYCRPGGRRSPVAGDVREAAREHGYRGLQYPSRLNAGSAGSARYATAARKRRDGNATMKSAVILLPGLNRDRDMIAAITKISGRAPHVVWQTETRLPDVDLIVIPGGYSYGDYLRCGAIAARMPVMRAVAEQAARGVPVLGVCNGFQILVEAGLLPGALMRNHSLRFVCRMVRLEVCNTQTGFTRHYQPGQLISCPVAHHDGNYFADAETLARLEGEGRVV